MDEDHGVDTDTDELYSKNEFFIDEVKFIRAVRLCGTQIVEKT